jgi:hypothetical protein
VSSPNIYLVFEGSFSAAFIIASLVSFRAFFTQRVKKANEHDVRRREQVNRDQKTPSSPKSFGFRRRARRFHDSLLETFKTTETVNDIGLPIPPSGRFSPTFITDIEAGYASKDRTDLLESSSNQGTQT